MNSDQIQKIIEEILNKMGVDYSAVEFGESEGRSRFLVRTSDSSLLIGVRGENLKALNYLVKRMLPEDQEAHFVVDVEDYFLQKVEKIKYAAKVSAERAKFLKEDVEMEPMSSYERMVVHSVLSDDPDISTESRGVGGSRRVVIKFKMTDAAEEDQF